MTRPLSIPLAVAIHVAALAMPLSAQSIALEDGRYTAADGHYSVAVLSTDGSIRTVEPNHTSTYQPTDRANVYHYTSNGERTAGTVYGLHVIDARSFEAFKPGVNGPGTGRPGTRFTWSGSLTATAPSSDAADDAATPPAEKYQKKMEDDPANTHLWAACAMAALVKSQADGSGFAVYAKEVVASIKPIMETPGTNPCPDVIPNAIWSAD